MGMAGAMTNIEILNLLLDQHAELRRQMDSCEQAMDQAATMPQVSRAQLAVRVAELSRMLAEHNAIEERLLEPVLVDSDSFGEVRADLMNEQHRSEHRSMLSALEAAVSHDDFDDAMASVRAIVAELRQHMQHEERYYLNRRVVRDDIVSVDSMGG